VLASKIDVSISIDGLEPDIPQGVQGIRPEKVIVPLLGECMDEN
jgi:hypothetical protein